jgi:alcohol dehydrogenase class IV
VTGHSAASIADGTEWIRTLVRHAKIPPLRHYGIARSDFESLAEKAARSSSMQGNPLPLERGELLEILEESWSEI